MGFIKCVISEKYHSDTYTNLLRITVYVITCGWPENIRFKGHIIFVAFSHMRGLLQHIETPRMSAFMQTSPLRIDTDSIES